jgi:DNA polymerase (family 10)
MIDIEPLLSNAEIADRLESLAQLLSTQKENPYKVKAYRRAAARIRDLPQSLDEMVRRGEDLTQFPGIGAAIASAIREIATTGVLAKLERLRSEADPALAELSAHPRLDPNSKLRGFRVLKSSEVDILADGTLDYPDDLLRELDYTVCSIHSRFASGQESANGATPARYG